jgi:hypothetical protein
VIQVTVVTPVDRHQQDTLHHGHYGVCSPTAQVGKRHRTLSLAHRHSDLLLLQIKFRDQHHQLVRFEFVPVIGQKLRGRLGQEQRKR